MSRDAHEDLFETRSGGRELGMRRELLERAIRHLAASVHDDHARANFQMLSSVGVVLEW